MLVLYLDIWFVNGEKLLLFGFFVGFLLKFLKNGLYLDLVKFVKFNNMIIMLSVGVKEFNLMKYLVF